VERPSVVVLPVSGKKEEDSPETGDAIGRKFPMAPCWGFLFFEIEIGTGIEIDSLRFDPP
jgi:hypothetical protein